MKLRDEIVKIIVDKGLFAIIVLLIGFYLNRAIEKFRFQNSKLLELERQKSSLENDIVKDRIFRKISYLERQLSEFYWPIYIRLQKDNVIWEKVPNFSRMSNALPAETNEFLEKEILLKNHEEVVKILESKFHLSEANEALSEEILKYIRHVTVYTSIRKVESLNSKNPLDFNEPFPDNFTPLFKAKLDEIQSNYNQLINEVKNTSKEF